MLQQCSSLLAWRLHTPFRAPTRPGLWGADIVRRCFNDISAIRRSAEPPATPFFRPSLAPRPFPWRICSIPGVNNANQWRTYDQIDMTHLHVTLSAHLDLRVEVVVPVRHPRVSSTYGSEMGQGNETGSRKNMRNRPQLTVAAPLLSASTQYLFRLLPLLSPSPFGREARGHRHRVISPSASAAAVLRRCPSSVRGGGTPSAPSRGPRETAAAEIAAGDLVPVISRHRRPQGCEGKAELYGPGTGGRLLPSGGEAPSSVVVGEHRI